MSEARAMFDTAAAMARGSPAGWHPLGVVGLAAGVIGVLLIAASDLSGVPAATHRPGSDPVTPSAGARLEAQGVAMQERLARFPGASERAAQIAAIAALAGEVGLDIDTGEYRDTDSPMPGELTALEVRMPLRGSSAAARDFLAGLQREFPWLAIDHLALERDAGRWRGEIRGRLFLRTDG